MTDKHCPICGRPLGTVRVEGHHLVPRTFKGKELVDLHSICHRKIHSVFTERELLNYYHTVERITEHGEMQKFIKWVQKKPSDYYDGSSDTNVRRGKRR